MKTLNPCPCGYLGHPKRGCKCTPTQLQHHAARVSGPVLDRLDLQIEVPALTSAELLVARNAEPSSESRARVMAARDRQRERGGLNARLTPAALRVCAPLDAAGRGAAVSRERGAEVYRKMSACAPCLTNALAMSRGASLLNVAPSAPSRVRRRRPHPHPSTTAPTFWHCQRCSR